MKINYQITSLAKNPVVWLGFVAALLYSSWPLGYILNPSVAHNAFASQLEASGQPYNWLFVGLDLLAGCSFIIVGIFQWNKVRSIATKLSIIGYMVFGLLVTIAALIPFNCSSPADSCYDIPHSPVFVVHGLASIVSGIALLVSLVLILKSLIIWPRLYWVSMVCISTLVCWGLLGILAVDRYHRADENLVQYAFISVCSISLVLAVIVIEYLSYFHLKHTLRENSESK